MIPILTVSSMRERDAETIRGGIPARELMRRAGEAIFHAYPWRAPVAIVCGSGNNAGDGYVLALCLQRAKIACTLVQLSDAVSTDGGYFLEKCREIGVPVTRFSENEDFSDYAVIADCIFGTGFRGTVAGIEKAAIERINESGKPVVSADINSGLNGDNGQGDLSVRSDLTVSVGPYQPGHFLGVAKDVIGSLAQAEIGMESGTADAYLVTENDFAPVLRPRQADSHKGNYGYITILGGCTEYSGAVKLANLSAAALRAGCGVASLAVPASLVPSVSPYLLESTLFPLPDRGGKMQADFAAIDACVTGRKAVAVGMGWGKSTDYAKILTHLLQSYSGSLVIDADGLNTLAGMDQSLLENAACKVVLTPHLKEFERISGKSVETFRHDPIGCAKTYAKEHHVVLLLKGTCTVVTDGDDVLFVNRGCAGMATAGSGDVLSGILAGLLGYNEVNALTVACGAYLAGMAGELAERACNAISMVASDTVRMIPQAVSACMNKT